MSMGLGHLVRVADLATLLSLVLLEAATVTPTALTTTTVRAASVSAGGGLLPTSCS